MTNSFKVGLILGIILFLISYSITNNKEEMFSYMIMGYYFTFILCMLYFFINFQKDMKEIRERYREE